MLLLAFKVVYSVLSRGTLPLIRLWPLESVCLIVVAVAFSEPFNVTAQDPRTATSVESVCHELVGKAPDHLGQGQREVFAILVNDIWQSRYIHKHAVNVPKRLVAYSTILSNGLVAYSTIPHPIRALMLLPSNPQPWKIWSRGCGNSEGAA